MLWRFWPTIRGAPADLREKSLRLAAHLLEYDPKLRGGSGYARARELLDSGAALKQMQKIIDAQGPPTCCVDLGNLTFDVTASSDGVRLRHRLPATESDLREPRVRRSIKVPASDCSRKLVTASSRESRSTASMRLSRSEHDLAAAGTKVNTAYTIGSK